MITSFFQISGKKNFNLFYLKFRNAIQSFYLCWPWNCLFWLARYVLPGIFYFDWPKMTLSRPLIPFSHPSTFLSIPNQVFLRALYVNIASALPVCKGDHNLMGLTVTIIISCLHRFNFCIISVLLWFGYSQYRFLSLIELQIFIMSPSKTHRVWASAVFTVKQ